jgi:hypothetical protein
MERSEGQRVVGSSVSAAEAAAAVSGGWLLLVGSSVSAAEGLAAA